MKFSLPFYLARTSRTYRDYSALGYRRLSPIKVLSLTFCSLVTFSSRTVPNEWLNSRHQELELRCSRSRALQFVSGLRDRVEVCVNLYLLPGSVVGKFWRGPLRLHVGSISCWRNLNPQGRLLERKTSNKLCGRRGRGSEVEGHENVRQPFLSLEVEGMKKRKGKCYLALTVFPPLLSFNYCCPYLLFVTVVQIRTVSESSRISTVRFCNRSSDECVLNEPIETVVCSCPRTLIEGGLRRGVCLLQHRNEIPLFVFATRYSFVRVQVLLGCGIP